MLNIVQSRKIWFVVSGLLCLLSIASLIIWGLNPAVDFTGGSLLEVQFKQTVPASVADIQTTLSGLNLGDISVQIAEDNNAIIRSKPLTEDQHQSVLSALKSAYSSVAPEEIEGLPLGDVIQENRFESVGPTIGQEMQAKAKWAITLAVIMIILYVAWAFRKISKVVSSWKYGVGAIVALLHDILIVAGVFAVLGHFAGFEVDVLFITALLTVLGYSVNDTIVVYDRTRENLHKHPGVSFADTVNRSVNETLARSINTVFTTLIVLAAVFIWGGPSIKHFILALIIGIVSGGYSSIFVASNLLVSWERWSTAHRLKMRGR